jgi:hypothetical protein
MPRADRPWLRKPAATGRQGDWVNARRQPPGRRGERPGKPPTPRVENRARPLRGSCSEEGLFEFMIV